VRKAERKQSGESYVSPLVQLDCDFSELAIDLHHILTCRSIKRWGHEARHPVAHALQLADRLSLDNRLHKASSRTGQELQQLVVQD